MMIREKIEQCVARGYQCGQILLLQFLEHQGKTNPDLIRAVDSVAGGLGYAGKNCGALTAGACVLGLYTGRGPEEEPPQEDLIHMVLQLTTWFEDRYGNRFGGIDCENITKMSFDEKMPLSDVCRNIIEETYLKLVSLIEDFGLDVHIGRG
jgi:C_GCAxxG_C_C family probable redox protein